MIRTTRAGAVALALAVAGLPFVGAGTAHAAVGGGQVACRTSAAAERPATGAGQRTAPPVPKWRQYDDTPTVTQDDLAAVPPEETSRSFVAQEVRPQLQTTITIPVYVHVIKGTHRGERSPSGPKRVARVIATLNDAYAGGQSAESAGTRYRFALKKIDYRKRDGWYHAYLYGPRDKRMKRALHRGGASTLNLYINGGGPADFPILGWARFPWQYAGAPRLDGVTVNHQALPGGRATGYNLGDTTVHEVGHWLGLFHTFQNGCDQPGDLVGDTPAEAEPSYYCDEDSDTCTEEPGLDPVHNFMDYSLDSCMNQFTLGQVRRMDSAYEKWRQ